MPSPWSSVFELKVKSAMRVDTGRLKKKASVLRSREKAPPPPAAPAATEIPAPVIEPKGAKDELWREVYDQASGGWFFVNAKGETCRTLPENVLAEMVFM